MDPEIAKSIENIRGEMPKPKMAWYKVWAIDRFVVRCKMVQQVFKALEGYKTYIMCGAAILTAVGAYLDNAITGEDLVKAIFAAITAATIHHSVTTSAANTVKALNGKTGQGADTAVDTNPKPPDGY